MASQYQKKQDGKKPFNKRGGKGAKPKVAVVQGAPKHIYTAQCCNVVAEKPATLRDPNVKFEDRKATLGTWMCPKCHKKAKVSRSRNRDETIPGAKE